MGAKIRSGLLTCGLLLSTGLGAHSAWAQQSPPSAAPAPGARDVVQLHNGGMIRGTISELVPNDYVVIITLTGETRKFAMADVSHAGTRSVRTRTSSRSRPSSVTRTTNTLRHWFRS